MRAAGRGLKQPHFTIFHSEDGVVLRVDDETKCEVWWELALTKRELRLLLEGKDIGKTEGETYP